MRILMITSELSPYAKTGGLGEAVAALSSGLHARGHEVTVILPAYGAIDRGAFSLVERDESFDLRLGARVMPARILEATARDAATGASSERGRVLFLDIPELFQRPGLYGTPRSEFEDNADRFCALALGGLEVARVLALDPEIVHAHDWQTGLVPIYAALSPRGQRRPRTIFTVHNLAFQGLFEPDVPVRLGLPGELMAPGARLEFFGKASFLKAGLACADMITTVSPSYAREITTGPHGVGLDGVLRSRGDALVGIVNGIDPAIWNPATDASLPAHFDAGDMNGKATCKAALQRRLGLPISSEAMLVSWVSRLTWQKGVDLLEHVVPSLLSRSIQWAILGTGDRSLEDQVLRLKTRYPDRVATRIAFDVDLAHLMFGGGDAVLVPSRFEPCGLVQLYGLCYGAVPIVRRTGGLADTVMDCTLEPLHGNGFAFDGEDAGSVVHALTRAHDVFLEKDRWRAIQTRAMRSDHSVRTMAASYEEVYRETLRRAPVFIPARFGVGA